MGWVFRLDVMLDRMNQTRHREGRTTLTWAEVGGLLGMSRQAIQNLASNRELKATNTRFLEAFCRFFQCEPSELLKLTPPLGTPTDGGEVDRLLALGRELRPAERPIYHVEELYGESAAQRWAADRAVIESPPA